MSSRKSRQVTVRLTTDEYAEAMTLASIRNWRAWKKGTISDLIRALLTEAIQMNRLKEAEKNGKPDTLKKGARK